jgi:Rrf2 family protein
MMLSKKSIYGLKAIMNLARNPERGQALISTLADEEQIPKKFLEAILLALKNGGVLSSRIGKGGGYSLLGSPRSITIGKIIRILEGELAPLSCLSETKNSGCDDCVDESICGIRLVMADVQHVVNDVLNSVTLADMLDRSEAAAQTQKKVFDYSI